MSNRREDAFDSASESSSDDDGRYNRLKSTVQKTSGKDRRRTRSDSEEEGLYTGSESEDEQKKSDREEKKKSPKNKASRSHSPEDEHETKDKDRSDERKRREERRENRRTGEDDFQNRLDSFRNHRERSRRGGDRSEGGGGRGRRDRDRDGDRRDRTDSDGRDRRDRDRREDRFRDRNRRDGDRDRRRGAENGEDDSRGDGDKSEQKRRRDEEVDDNNKESAKEPETAAPEPKKAKKDDLLTTKTGGAYIPPARLKMMQQSITDKSSEAYQRLSWEALKKSINGLVNKVNVSNIGDIIRELFAENVVRGRGLMARSIIQAQAASPTFTHVFAALVAIINTKFPNNGELILKRLIIQFKRGYKRNDKNICMSATKFIGHLVNQQVAHEVISLEILTLLLENPSNDSVEIAVGFLKEVGQKLTDVSPRGINAIFERLRNVLHEGAVETRVQYMIEVMYAVRKDGFKDHVAVLQELDLVEEDEQFTHLLTLDDVTDGETLLDVFRADPEFLENEEKYKDIKKSILESDSSGDDESGSGSDSSDSDEGEAEEAKQVIIDQTETNLVALRRTIYLTIQSSLDFEECAHKLMKMELKPGQEFELCNMILDCCAQQRTFEKFYALLGQRFCQIHKKFIEPYEQAFQEQYETIHRLETAKLRNVAKFFAHLLHTDAISWGVLQAIKLNEDDTTSSSRIFIKILFQELSEFMGLPKLNTRLKDVTLAPFFESLFPRDNPRNTRFAINFFTSVGLGGLTDELRDHLKTQPKKPVVEQEESSASSSESESSSDESSSSSSSESSSDSEPSSKKKKTRQNQKKRKMTTPPPADKKKKKAKQKKQKAASEKSDSEPEEQAKRQQRKTRDRKPREREEDGNRKYREEKQKRGKENIEREEEEGRERASRVNKEEKRRERDVSEEMDDRDERSTRRRDRDVSAEKDARQSRRRKGDREDSADRNKSRDKTDRYEKRRERSREKEYSDSRRSSKYER